MFPRRGLFARAQPHDRAADPCRFAGLHLKVADEAVTLVEQADDRDALGHRGCALDPADFLRHAFGFGDLRRLVGAACLRRRGPVASAKRERGEHGQPGGRG
ncbi:MAG TPA: hypothetical protein VGD20_04685 [Sphingopyxis sp.]